MVDAMFAGQPVLEAGFVLAQRYEITALLGQGGMGAVYQAKDLELNRMVALKMIRRELAGNRAIIDRFKQELILSTQVTHRNVVRIYDLGEAEGTKFITMEYVEGQDLRTLIYERKKLPPAEAVAIIQQTCLALDAAHSVGVIHRDLKPQNIMQDKSGRIVVMDFGLARTLEGDGMTQTGALVGTMEYMSPEQALAKNLDQRSDIFSLGIIFYELLTGEAPFHADSALASLIKRTQERVAPVSDHDSTIPPQLSRIVNRCLERDLELRYQNASELLADLDVWQGKTTVAASTFGTSRQQIIVTRWMRRYRWWLIGGCAALVLLIAGTYVAVRPKSNVRNLGPLVAVADARALAVLPFRNKSEDPKDDWIGSSVADMLSTDIGQSAHLRTISADRLHQILSDMRIGSETEIDSDMLRRVAQFSNADTVVSGQFTRFGDQIVIDATIHDLKHDQTVPVQAKAAVKDLPATIDKLADSVRNSLSLSSSVIDELKAQSFKPNSNSVDALRDYNQGLSLMREGKNLDASKQLQQAVAKDPQFALALSRLGDVQSDLGFDSDAEQSSRRAVELAQSQNLPLPEKYLIDASHARIMKDNKKAIEAYENLSSSLPGDVDVQYNLGTLYVSNGDYAKAHDLFAKILKADPKNIKALWEMGVVENILGNPQAALESLSAGLSLATQLDNQEQKALILLSTGISYRLLGKPEEAMRNYQDSIAINEKIGQKRGVAAGLDMMADLQAMDGKSDAALASYNKALVLQREIGMKKEAGTTLNALGTVYQDRGDYDKALDAYRQALQIQRETGDQNFESLCLNNIGAVYLTKGDTDNAFTYYQQALQLREKLGVQADVAETLQGLGEAYTTTGQYDQALTSLLRALDLSRKAGDAHRIALVSHEIGLVFEYQGRFGSAIKSMQEAIKSFRDQGEHGRDMADFLNDYAGALARAGNGDQSAKALEDAEEIARGLKNDALNAIILNTRGDVAFYKGDTKGADQAYRSALQLASRSRDQEAIVLSKLNVARTTLAQGRAKEALASLKALLAGGTPNAHLGVQCAIAFAQAEVETGNYVQAERDLEEDLSRTEKAGMRLDSARIYYLRATAQRLSNTGDRARATYYYGEALRFFDVVRSDPGAENILRRADLKAMYDDATHWKG